MDDRLAYKEIFGGSLFTADNGESLHFYIKECKDKNEIQQLIEVLLILKIIISK